MTRPCVHDLGQWGNTKLFIFCNVMNVAFVLSKDKSVIEIYSFRFYASFYFIIMLVKNPPVVT